MKVLLFRIAQWTWGLPQTFLGFVLFLIHRKNEHFVYHGAVVTRWNHRGSVGLGMFVFLSQRDANQQRLTTHEYGHTIQSLILGPLFLIIVGIPSFLWATLPVCIRYRRRKKVSYHKFYTERWANRLGEWVTKDPALK